ncbi:GntR family transcriptional regulator [Reticulibacter mediterranei]|uniref:GntR family transcriptional regulator n=1 Tax=Reticulibacter mediterranei TaxID=2778369 RepID=A0A8J3IVF1_9CHLR|nr:FCD domain-containing protein [Reticulibacter mediterranei]GHO99268.1 GntR family transcriptional regulator [Reticulibacter mediterranei]
MKQAESVPAERPAGHARESTPYDVIFRPVRSVNAFEETIERLAQAIKLGVVPPGSKLPPEREMVAQFQISRATLREAIRALELAGYLRARRGRAGGTFVVYHTSEASEADARRLIEEMGDYLPDILDFRWVIEPATAELAAQRAKPADAQWLCSLQEEIQSLPRSEYRRLDSRFHLAIAELTGSRSLIAAVTDIHMQLNDLLTAFPLLDASLRHSNQQHEKIVRAIATGNCKCARAEMEEHVMATANLLRGFLS